MTQAKLDDLVRQAHDGEVLGEALFARLVASEKVPERRRVIHAAELLERQTRVAVERLAADLGVSVGAAEEQRAAGEQAAASLEGMSWTDRMAAIAGATGSYRALYEQLEAVVPDAAHPSMLALLAHERALNACAAAEAAGGEGALDHLVDALEPAVRSQLESSAV